MPGALLHCPIRGTLSVPEKAADGLTYTEEKRRIDCIQFLLAKGYPQHNFKIETSLLRFGHKGRNSFRTDIAVLDSPVSTLPTDIEALKPHIKLIAEIKRDNTDAKLAKQTQVYPALDFLHDLSALGIYWDDIEQRLFYRTLQDTKTKIHEVPAAVIPRWGMSLGAVSLKNVNLSTSSNLRGVFQRIEDRMHSKVTDKSARFEIMLQLLLAKLYDEHIHPKPNQEMTIQDFSDALIGDTDVKKVFNDILARSVNFYGKYLPKAVSASFSITGAMLKDVSSLLAPIRILGSRRDVIQDFYMYFAQGVYKWDLAQYFTPSEVVDFIVSLTNPQAGDQVKDPACGSSDFLISTFHYADNFGANLRDSIWGADNSENAVQISILNMLLNGDGKGNIKQEDSLANVDRDVDSYSVMLCNPPFGVQIKERSFEILSKFDLAHTWIASNSGVQMLNEVAKSQEVGLLFAELCVKQAQPKGRVGIILPNGYLGNRSVRYLAFREWLLRHTRLVAVVGFPRFTFKKSGADVSASVLLLEKREKPLLRAKDSENYPFYAGIIESVGWNLSGNKAERIFKRNAETGDFITDENNEQMPDADFNTIIDDLRRSPVINVFPWLMHNVDTPLNNLTGWSVNISNVLQRADLSIDSKRWCRRAVTVREQIKSMPYFALKDIIEVIPEAGTPKDKRGVYQYVELQDVADGVITPNTMRGWELPDRAKHLAEAGDIFVGRIWGSVGKWFVASNTSTSIVVSNGFHRLRLKPNKQEYIIDLIAGLNTEAYRIQARSYATGSDGLAELSRDDLTEIVLPRVTDPSARQNIQSIVDALLAGRVTVASVVSSLLEEGRVPTADVVPRSTNWVQV